MSIENPVELTPEQIVAVGKTSLRHYKIPPLVYRAYCDNALHSDGRLLDYGCGKNPVHIPPHCNMEIVRYDICHFPKRPEGLFDDILVSNVLNVLPDYRTLVQTIGDVASLLKPEGWVYVNFPSSPRKAHLDDGTLIGHEYVEVLLRLTFKEVDRFKDWGTKSSPVFICVGKK